MEKAATTAAPAAKGGGSTAGRRWLWAVLVLLAIAAVVAIIRLVPFGTAFLGDTDRRNARDLEIVAARLEGWSEAVDQMARSQFVPGRVTTIPVDSRDRDDGWDGWARVRHAAYGEYRLLYAVRRDCSAMRGEIALSEGALPFVRSYQPGGGTYVKMLGSFPVAEIWRLDMRSAMPADTGGAPSEPVRAYLENIFRHRLPALDAPAGPAVSAPADRSWKICYGVVVPLSGLLFPDQASRRQGVAANDFGAVLLAAPDNRILAQEGRMRLPLGRLEQLRVDASDYSPELAGALTAVTGQTISAEQMRHAANKLQPDAAVERNLAPTTVTIGDVPYRAYIRPFFPPADGFPACQRGMEAADRQGAKDGGAQKADQGLRGACYVVGLVPKASLWRQWLSAPPAPLFALTLAIAGLVVLLPALRLILLGPGDALMRVEAAVLVLGIPAAASLATLALLVQSDLGVARAAAERTAESIATDARTALSRQVRAAIEGNRASGVVLAGLAGDAFQPGRAPAIIQSCVQPAGGMPDGIETSQPANPRPLFCANAAKQPFCGPPVEGAAPILSFLVDADGRQPAVVHVPEARKILKRDHSGTRLVACRYFSGGRTFIPGRAYFQRMLRGQSVEADYGHGRDRLVVDHVIALHDGLPQTIVATEVNKPEWYVSRGSTSDMVMSVSASLLSFQPSALVRSPFGMMVVDARTSGLPVVSHPVAGRAGVERFAAMVDNGVWLERALRQMVDTRRADLQENGKGEVKKVRFRAFYGGAERQFIAVPVSRTGWAILVHYPLPLIDAAPIQSGWRALLSWMCFSVLFGGAWLVWLLIVGQDGRSRMEWIPRFPHASPAARIVEPLRHFLTHRLFGPTGWPRLWPQQRHRSIYRSLAAELALLAGVGALMLFLLGGRVHPVALLTIALIIRMAAGLLVHILLAPDNVANSKLTPGTQRNYLALALALALCVSVVPMAWMWRDARAVQDDVLRREIAAELGGANGDIANSKAQFRDFAWVLGIDPFGKNPPQLNLGFRWSEGAKRPDDGAATFAGELARLAGAGDAPQTPSCGASGYREPVICGAAAKAVAGSDDREDGLVGITWEPPHLWTEPMPIRAWIPVLLFAALLSLAFFLIVRATLKALCGFGVPLDAVHYPQLFVGDLWGADLPAGRNFQTLNHKSILVNAPFTLSAMLDMFAARSRGVSGPYQVVRHIDLAAAAFSAADHVARPGEVVKVSGLETILENGARRLAALALLEKLVSSVDDQLRINPDTAPYLLFLSPAAPLDRILDAYERETRIAAQVDVERENLRWARLFEDFATFQFGATELCRWPALRMPGLDDDARAAVITVFRELRWLSPRIVNGCLNIEQDVPPHFMEPGILPLTSHGRSIYPALYARHVLNWARERCFPSPAAALTFLHGQFIEHYQRQWSASTRAERIVLHHLAHGRFVNIERAVAFSSLVRRGLVVLDPDPQLMNRSFAMFVRQVEKLDAIRSIRDELPRGAWMSARRPILIGLGLLLLALAFLMKTSGQNVANLLPLLVAGVPALAAGLARAIRTS